MVRPEQPRRVSNDTKFFCFNTWHISWSFSSVKWLLPSTPNNIKQQPPPPPPVPSQTSIIESHELVKKAIQQTMSESKNWNLLVINKYHNDTNATFNNLPEWAVGTQLNLAVVNQLYYNPTGNGVFNKPKI